MFNSIYGTQVFQGFTLPLERRAEMRNLIGERAEQIACCHCAMTRATLDASVAQDAAPYRIIDRFTQQEVELPTENFDDLCRVHLCD